MKKLLFALALMASASAFAAGMDTNTVAQAGFSSLSESEKAEVIAVITAKAAATAAPKVSADNVDKWVDISAKLGKGLAATARELGIAANEFAVSPLGMIATALIVWHVMGTMIIHVFGGLMIWTIGFPTLRYIVSRAYPTETTYDPEKRDKFGRAVVLKQTREEFTSEGFAVVLLAHGAVLAAGLVAMFTF